MSVEYGECSWRASTNKTTENVEKIWDLIHEDCRWTVRELAHTAGISYGVCQILTQNLNMCCIQLVPYDAVDRNTDSIHQLAFIFLLSHYMFTTWYFNGLFLIQRISCTYAIWCRDVTCCTSVPRLCIPNTCYHFNINMKIVNIKIVNIKL
jgi:hypothetical protein